MSNRLANKVCIITGTSGSIGQAAAVAFVSRGSDRPDCSRFGAVALSIDNRR
jgi:NAD(P)-dependent dehydrogenase (short-subunit alcohol dehydrogenase family)